ncbi:phytanoyl-CoA dioxygenase family protein [Aidingimonas halophila]|uniref:Ectoine hydroxylase-related dioxygenase, phytanoyl-CoA dioxygenase (PhyH) family n=1 Tax=Aidingimonas halophila TaxID=574349 RepID=A0A1H2ZDN8_9GAMM|nr:phytanoyl-CoA dioxygenase family protein [Aidingimonas halophila]GHC15825.1 phytanoyl-CoA dioxygenase [Aidingimonas halophila]SDX15476.1 Ectoine hydroxylase-related dioxygenase, phytanoyl-CoA dioxygenase (PhyH) family [Aidingimonas halophila]
MTQLQPKLVAASTPPKGDIAAFATLCEQWPSQHDYPTADRIEARIPIYAGDQLRQREGDITLRQGLLTEWHRCLLEGPGVMVIENLYADTSVIDAATQCFLSIIETEKTEGGRGDHFAPSGSNDRIWNAFQKHAETDPEGFLDYYSNPLLDWICEAWLGPFYQITSQVNVVNPGGRAQQPHRDYHLGFQTDETVRRFPISMQHASQLLTLQGAIAHGDMPIETGPTQLLPYSQQYPQGYMSYRDPSFQDHFAEYHVQLPLGKGDGLFFSPALFHAAGENDSRDQRRMANLLQVSSAFGRTMETVDTRHLVEVSYDSLKRRVAREGNSPAIQAFIAAVAEGYSFPANLDKTPPEGGMAPESQQQLLRRALQEDWSLMRLQDALQYKEAARRA